jgi:hypothetical protein
MFLRVVSRVFGVGESESGVKNSKNRPLSIKVLNGPLLLVGEYYRSMYLTRNFSVNESL